MWKKKKKKSWRKKNDIYRLIWPWPNFSRSSETYQVIHADVISLSVQCGMLLRSGELLSKQ